MNTNLISVLSRCPNLKERFTKKVSEVKEDKKNLLIAANSFNKKYETQILEGTRKRQKLLSEGKAKGFTEDEILSSSQFLPSVYTPILNFLYFMFSEEKNESQNNLEKLIKEYIEEFGYKNVVKALEEVELEDKGETKLEDILSDDVKNPKEMESYIYENIGHDLFKKIKKLKRLVRSPNSAESALAYKKCRELCDEYHLDYYKIPD